MGTTTQHMKTIVPLSITIDTLRGQQPLSGRIEFAMSLLRCENSQGSPHRLTVPKGLT